MQKKSNLNFPKKFLWGAATAAHQVEGGTHNQWTEWEIENAKVRSTQAPHQWDDLKSWSRVMAQAKDPQNYVSDKAAGHYQRYIEDFDYLTSMHMNVFRFSIEWSRIEPAQGVWDAAAIDHYKTYIAELKKRGIEPVVTLFHFTLPVWFAQLGGFERRTNVKYFVRFADTIIRELGMSVRYIITINEPEIYATQSYLTGQWPPEVSSKWRMWRVMKNLARAHNQSARAIHAINRRYKVSIAKNSSYFYPGDNAWLSRVSAAIMQYIHDDYFLRKVVKRCDFIGMNYYFSNRVYGYRVHNQDDPVSDVGWDLSPDHIQYALERVYAKYKLPILITENGLADGEDSKRQWFITQTLSGMQKAIDNDVKLLGYLHWSLLDNFEWEKGRWPRFGLLEVNYKTMERTLRPSAKWFGKIIKHIRTKTS
ncbi:MAG: glycoside hydrolase family 1 protein [Candidatus Saccharimonadales bacterium]